VIEKVPGGTGRYLSYFGKVTGGIERYHEVPFLFWYYFIQICSMSIG